MPIPRSSVVLCAALVLLGSAGGAAGCAYDWAVGAASTEGSDAGAPDATVEAAVDATSPGDAGPLDSAVEASDDAADSGPPSMCSALESQLNAARTAAKRCDDSTPNQCASAKVIDECGCNSFVLDASSTATADFSAAVSSFQDAGCALMCPDGGCPFQMIGSCIPNSGHYVCYP